MSNFTKLPLIAFPLIFLVFLSKGQVNLNNPPLLSEKSVVSLITGAPGEILYTRWGHSAVRIFDPENEFDIVYNYGTFDFKTPGFYPNFINGKLLYYLSVYDFRYMIRDYQYRNLNLFEQQLDLTLEEKQKVFDYLNNNYKPENRYYLYDFLFNNCSSIIRDVFEEILGSKLQFNDDYIVEHISFRQLLNKYLEPAPWGEFGINISLGIPTDQIASSREYMFLPYEMMRAFGTAKLIGSDMQYPFVKFTNMIYQQRNVQIEKVYLTPMFVFWTLFGLVVLFSFYQYRSGKYFKWIDIALFGIVGAAGLLFAFMWFGTDHTTTRWNLNILWASPLHILIPVVLIRKKPFGWLKYYSIFSIVLILVNLAGWYFLPQQFHIAIIPICLTLTLRLGYLMVYKY
ncbi:DUF4105 domain-containing protein [Bacteroidota bacterium]